MAGLSVGGLLDYRDKLGTHSLAVYNDGNKHYGGALGIIVQFVTVEPFVFRKIS